MPTPSFSWLHLTDFHFGLHGQNNLWPNLRQSFFEDLAKLHDKTGPWDAVFFTGDLVQQGKPDEFTAMQREVLDRLWKKLTELGSGHAKLLAVPGNHDLCRPDPKADNPAADTLLADDGFSGIAGKFWANSTTSYRKVIDDAFAEYTQWWHTAPHRPEGITTGELPGDFACTLVCGDQRIGIIGLNTAFLQLKAGDFKGKLVWNVQQLSKVCGDAVDDWEQRHSLCFLLTHQGPDWLTPEAQQHGTSEISPAGRFALHLFGHMHEHALQYIRNGGSPQASRLCQGSSVFGMEKFGNPPTLTRSHGYAIGKIEFALEGASLRVWPRVATDKPSGWRFVSDNQNCHLEADEGTAAEALTLRPLRATSFAARSPEPVAPPTLTQAAPRTFKLYGRETLLQDAAKQLHAHPFLLIYGMRGNGKTEFIKALAEKAPLQGKEPVRIVLDPAITPDYLFRQFANLLGDTTELPRAPQGDAAAITAEIQRRYPNPRPAWIWLDQAHHLLGADGFHRSDIRHLLTGLQAALGTRWHWILELRERPPRGLFGSLAASNEIPGLDRGSLRACLAEAAPQGQTAEWSYSGDQLKRIYGWLGGGHGKQAHPLAIQLLIEVARGRNETPRNVLERHIGEFEQKVEEVLIGDLYFNVLCAAEQQLIQALALYRTVIPHDHLEKLEQSLEVSGAWDGLDRRCLLSASPDDSKYYLHSFIAAWLRTHQLGYASHGEDGATEFAEATREDVRQSACRLHSMIATCWLQQLGSSRKTTNLNIARALEAFHHLISAGDADRIRGIAVELLTGNLEWAKQRIESLYRYRYHSKASIVLQRQALVYWATLEPENHMVQRFLGECWAKEEGRASTKALRCFEAACTLDPGFPQYWANLGRTLLAQGEAGAQDFLQRLTALEQDCPQAIDDHVRSIKSECLNRVGNPTQAAALRMAQINAGSRDAVFYADEAKARLDASNAQGALEILDLAEKNGAVSTYTQAIRASALQQTNPTQAAALRMAQINAGSRHGAFYADEAKARLDAGNAQGALEILDLAEKNGAVSTYTQAIRASALQQTNPTQAAALRMAQINAGSRHGVFYADEAKARLDAGNAQGTLEILDLAEKNGAADDYTHAIRASALQQTDPTQAAALRMAQINAGSRNGAFYADEAKARLDAGNAQGTLEILDLAEKNGAADDYTHAIRASALQQTEPTRAAANINSGINCDGDKD
ncbi:metallophosphoesterase [Burkholderia cepacia]|uniref:metallophosphoesterase n=1 Tax=Burkholderia cepacia TaxID=292 RepID=UPI002FE2698D